MTANTTKSSDAPANGESSLDSSFPSTGSGHGIVHNSSFPATYPGGKGLLYQRLISLIPPHDTYIAPFAGFDAIARMKRPARVNIAIDADAAALDNLRSAIVGNDEGFRKSSPEIASVATLARIDGAGASPLMASGAPIVGSDEHRGTPELAMAAGRVGNNDARPSLPPAMPPGRPATNSDTAGSWQFLNTDALAWLAAYDWRGGEFCYLDPPYLRSTRKQARALYRYEMSDDQHRALLSILVRLPCNVMVSGYYSAMYAEALACGQAEGASANGWHVATFETTTRGGSPATEWVWMNYPTPVALHDYRYLGDGFRERERIKRKKRRWVEKLRRMETLEKQAILAAIEEAGL